MGHSFNTQLRLKTNAVWEEMFYLNCVSNECPITNLSLFCIYETEILNRFLSTK